MGASDFYHYSAGEHPKEAYEKARREAREENGYRGGYSGDIQTTNGWLTIRSRTPMTGSEAMAFAESDIDNMEKWGPAFAVPVTREKPKPLTRPQQLLAKVGKLPKRELKIDGWLFYGWGAS
jgi:hypothetical protein